MRSVPPNFCEEMDYNIGAVGEMDGMRAEWTRFADCPPNCGWEYRTRNRRPFLRIGVHIGEAKWSYMLDALHTWYGGRICIIWSFVVNSRGEFCRWQRLLQKQIPTWNADQVHHHSTFTPGTFRWLAFKFNSIYTRTSVKI